MALRFMTCPFKIRLFTNVFPAPNDLHESALFHLQGWRGKWRCSCSGSALSQRLKDSHQSKKFTNLMSGRLWTTRADINWYVYAWLAAATATSITSLFNRTLAASKSKFLVRMLSYQTVLVISLFSYFLPLAVKQSL